MLEPTIPPPMMMTSAEFKTPPLRWDRLQPVNARFTYAILLNRRGSVYLPSSAAALEESGLTIFFHCVAPVCFSNPKGPSAQVVPVLRRTLFRKSWVSVGWSFQVSPPSWLIRKPSSVVIQPWLAPSKPIDVSQPETGVFLVSQVAPPSLVRNNCPAKPEIQPFLASGKKIELSDHWAPGILTTCHLFPPSVVCRTVPDHPDAQPFWASRKYRHSSESDTGEFCLLQVLPPSAECTITPSKPTIQP